MPIAIGRTIGKRNGASFYTLLDAQIMVLHDRGVLDENALLAVLKDLADGKPLTFACLAGIFGVECVNELVLTTLEGVL